MATQPGLDGAGVHRDRSNAAPFDAPVEADGEEHVRGFRTTIGDEFLVRRVLEIGIVEIDIGEAMSGGRKDDDACARLQARHEAIDEYKVAEVIRAELRLEAVGSLALRTGHHARVGDDRIELLSLRNDRIGGGGAHAGERGEIERYKLQAAPIRCRRPHRLGRGARLVEVARAHDRGAVSGERPRRLHAEAGGDAGHDDPFA